MKDNQLIIGLDFIGKPYIVKANKKDGSKTRLSTHDALIEEINCFGSSEELLYGITETGIYRLYYSGEGEDSVPEFEMVTV